MFLAISLDTERYIISAYFTYYYQTLNHLKIYPVESKYHND